MDNNEDWRRKPCIIETAGSPVGIGHRQIWWRGKHWLAHRKAWVEGKGEIPEGGCICHHCDRPACKEVTHLFLGTRRSNNADRHRKGRSATTAIADALRDGGRIARADAERIRECVLFGAKQRDVAAAWQISPQYVNDVVKHRELN